MSENESLLLQTLLGGVIGTVIGWVAGFLLFEWWFNRRDRR
jgi:uncharacterized membrane protein YccC